MKDLARQIYARLPLKQPLFEVARRLVRVPEQIYRHLHFKGVFQTRVDGRTFKMVHHGYQVENEVFWAQLNDGWEHVSLGVWRQLCQQAQVILDIGANTGIYALLAKTVNPAAKVVAFEPVTRVFANLVKNVQLNDYDVVCEEVAVSNNDGEAVIYDLPTENIYSVTVNKNLNAPGVETIERKIRTVRLDSYLRQHQIAKVDLMKIDVETHEFEVLQGLGEVLHRSRPTMLIEILNDEVGQAVQGLVAGKGYRYFNIDERNPPRPVAQITHSDHFNFLICQAAVADSIGLPPA